MDKTTEDLQNDITKARTLEEFRKLQEKNEGQFSHPSALEYIQKVITEHGLERKEYIRTVIMQSNLERTYVYHLLSGEKKLTRDKLIMFALAGKFTIEEANNLLKYAGEATLYARNKRDYIIAFAFKQHYSVMDVNDCLADLKLELLK